MERERDVTPTATPEVHVDIEWLPVRTGVGRVCKGTVIVNGGEVASRTEIDLQLTLVELIKYLARTGHAMTEAIVKLTSQPKEFGYQVEFGYRYRTHTTKQWTKVSPVRTEEEAQTLVREFLEAFSKLSGPEAQVVRRWTSTTEWEPVSYDDVS